MMARASVKLSREWDDILKTLEPSVFRARLLRASAIAGGRVGYLVQAKIRQGIQSGRYADNSPITVILKGSSRPLVDKGDLFQSITYDQPDPWSVRVGIMRRKVGDDAINLAAVLHDGATIDVGKHPRVRRKVFAMVSRALSAERLAALVPRSRRAVSNAAGGLGGGGSRRDVWIIPPRPFITDVLTEASMRHAVEEHYGAAVRAAFGAR